MRLKLVLALTLALASTVFADSSAPLIKANNFTYLGAFRVPATDPMSGGGSAIAYNPANNSLFIVGRRGDQQVAEINIPALVNSPTIANLNTATFRQNLTDVTEGKLLNIGVGGAPVINGAYIGGLLVSNNKLIGTVYDVFDANSEAALSHFTSGLNFAATGDVGGMYKVGTLNPGFVGGWMTDVPSDLRTMMGGPALTGQGELSIVSRTSYGPSAFAFDPAQLGVTNPVPVTPLLYYPQDHQTLGNVGVTSHHWGVRLGGITMIDGTRSVLFFSTMGIGPGNYGGGETNPLFADECKAPDTCSTAINPPYSVCTNPNVCTTGYQGLPYPPGHSGAGLGYFYDPTNETEGPHSYPYMHLVWAYDANDLAHVKNGDTITTGRSANIDASCATGTTYQPWCVKPYATWTLPGLGTAAGPGYAITASYDSAHGVLYVVEPGADHAGDYINTPLIRAYSLNMSATPASSYKVGGKAMLLNGSVVLRNNGGDSLTVSASSRTTIQDFAFSTSVANGGAFDVTIASQPTGQTCQVLNGTGAVSANADVNTVVVTCTGAGSGIVTPPPPPTGTTRSLNGRLSGSWH